MTRHVMIDIETLVIVRQRDNAMAGHPILEGVAAYSVETLEEGCALVRLLLGA